MSSWFITKKVEGSETLSEKLAEIRKANNFDLDYLSGATKISKKFLIYLEEGKLEKMPPEIYVKGFLKKLADLYKVEVKSFLRLYERENSIRKNIDKSKYPPLNLSKAPTFIITPRTITVLLTGLIVVFFFGFLFYQLSFIIKGPELIIDYPQDGFVTNKTSVLVSGGLKDLDATVSINGKVINLKEGKIAEIISLNSGLNIIEISAVNKFKRSNSVTRRVILKEN